eukprot:TRINITY_DN6363_c0_g3_i1.p1 TRINITY_DN6363_c0_g3~~TRINITY_DN6363_c0_g3_i1.p1  ORF type:complete len:426 (-),score=119.66 TRINITY_DN6363_c0_g3_i1:298-1575(-)
MAKPVTGRASSGGSFASSTASGGSSSSSCSGRGRAAKSAEESEKVLREIGFNFQGGAPPAACNEADAGFEAASEAGDSEAASGEDTPRSTSRRLSGVAGSFDEGERGDQLLFDGLRRRLISPLDVHFSQAHIRPEFQDGRTVDDSAELVVTELLQTPPTLEHAGELGLPTAEGGDSGRAPDSWWLLKPPFPEIEVIRWRCKLRKEDGSIKTDDSGMELYGPSEWYTLDNRRLYCLQKAAAKLHPAQVRCSVIVIKQEEGNCREFRKFRTVDLGRTVRIGHRDSGELPRWSWRQQVGLAEPELPQGTAIASRHQAAARRRSGAGRPPYSGDRRKSNRKGYEDEDEDEEPGMFDGRLGNVLLFIIVYMLLRIVFHIGRHLLAVYTGTKADSVVANTAAETQLSELAAAEVVQMVTRTGGLPDPGGSL